MLIFLLISIALAISASYELLEWASTFSVPAEQGMAFLGSQGDIWDAQKDMLMAGMGAILAMAITAIVLMIINKYFWKEFRESLSIPKHDHELGEVKLESMLKKNRR